jgi:hypothetical protein
MKNRKRGNAEERKSGRAEEKKFARFPVNEPEKG